MLNKKIFLKISIFDRPIQVEAELGTMREQLSKKQPSRYVDEQILT